MWAQHRLAPTAGAGGLLFLVTLFLLLTSRRETNSRLQGNPKKFTFGPCSTEGKKEKPFIFVYDFGGKYTDEVRKSEPSWFSEVYDAEKVYLEYILGSSSIRTWDPEKALLFYVPFHAAYFLSCHFKDWENNMRESVVKTSEAWEAVLTQVRTEYPYFNRTNGGDHFSVLSMDFGRCQSLTYVEPRLYGDMFFLTATGDKMLRSTHTHIKRNMQILTYNYGAQTSSDIPDIPCFRSDRDLVIPPTLEEMSKRPMLVTSPFQGDRSTTVLFRFRVEHHHKQAVLHSNHYIRKELYDLFRRKGLEGWEFGVREPEKILREDMEHSVFCVCPPGHSQWTTRLVKAILAGCIPITFFRDNQNPWEDEIDYTSFSINVDPEELGALFEKVEETLRNPRKLLSMQRNLERVQRLFVWNETDPLGVQSHITHELWCRAQQKERGTLGSMKRIARLTSLRSKNGRRRKA